MNKITKSKIVSVLSKTFFSAALMFSFLTFCACSKPAKPSVDLTIEKVDGSTALVSVEVARTEQERQRGFMERKKIPDGTGMIFVFEGDQILNFWMKNTPTALSIAYIDRNGIIRDIFDMTPFSLEAIESTCSVRYALEVPKGWFSKNGIKVGDRVVWDHL